MIRIINLQKKRQVKKDRQSLLKAQFKSKQEVSSYFILGDHVITLNDKGEVYAMGDDTFGQCGQAESDRNTCPPFT